MLEGIIFTVIVVAIFVGLTYLCSTKDRRIDSMEEARMKRERDLYKWL